MITDLYMMEHDVQREKDRLWLEVLNLVQAKYHHSRFNKLVIKIKIEEVKIYD